MFVFVCMENYYLLLSTRIHCDQSKMYVSVFKKPKHATALIYK